MFIQKILSKLASSMALKLTLISTVFMFTFHASAHEFYFSFAEMQYNPQTEQFEISLEVTGHDLEDYLKDKGIAIPRLEDCIGNPIYLNTIEQELTKGFQLFVQNSTLALDLIGMKINDNDQVVFFLTSRKMKQPKSMTIKYDLLMNFFPLQQNKLTFFKPEGKQFVTFLNTRSKRTIEL
ncbi:DUF6702 family protein [Brumimicrobium oceani]|uniref:Peptidase E n=1 Tax=Brumimicrobium oceani TaxID=2100725 RepID=A0A2U2XDE4_9FLAO|nr:DUF6702 family protein [Brumimicrobium oceani]PWH85787.1 hypothetical protein DIT68_06750 [Brumimicrobium oceani]